MHITKELEDDVPGVDERGGNLSETNQNAFIQQLSAQKKRTDVKRYRSR